MSNQNRPVQVLVPTAATLLAAGNRVEDLAVGQMGFFNADTGTSFVAATVTGDPSVARRFFMAVGLDRDADTVLDDIAKSAGEHIQSQAIDWYDVQCYAAALPKIVDIVDFTANCDTTYAVKVEIRNQASYRQHGYNQAVQTFTFHTACCDECATCPTGDCNELAEGLYDNINGQEETWVVATYIARLATVQVTGPSTAGGDNTITIGTTDIVVTLAGGTDANADAAAIAAAINADGTYDATVSTDTVTIATGDAVSIADATPDTTNATYSVTASAKTAVADIDAFKLAYPDSCVGLRLTSSPLAIESYCNVNLKYFDPRGTDIIVSLVSGTGQDGFECTGAVETQQELTFEQGSGYDIAQLEMEAGGWSGKPGPYRQSTLAGTEVGNFDQFADKAGHYVQVNLGYLNKAQSGWQQYESPIETVVAVACADTEDGDIGDLIVNVLDAIVAANTQQFPARTATLVACGTAELCPDL